MDLRNIVSNTPKPQLQPRVSIDNLVNAGQPNVSEIRNRSSITSITNESDVDMRGNSVSRRSSSNTPANKRAIEHDLKMLEQLEKNQDGIHKPKRYDTPPVWARDYVPVIRKRKQKVVKKSSLSAVSMTESVPYDDLTNGVTSWIYSNIVKVKEDYSNGRERAIPNILDYLELELKVGQIFDKKTERRVILPVANECIISSDFFKQNCFFNAGIGSQNFHDANDFLESLKDAFVQTRTNHVDSVHSESQRDGKPINVRVTRDKDSKRVVAVINKMRVSDLVIFMPNFRFDMRLSMSLEIPKTTNETGAEAIEKRANMVREKTRTSFNHKPTFTQVDLTKIKESSKKKPPASKCELELELESSELVKSIDILAENNIYFVDLVKAFLDNGRILVRKLG